VAGSIKPEQAVNFLIHNETIHELIDPDTGLMECAFCGQRHWANIKPQSSAHRLSPPADQPVGTRADGRLHIGLPAGGKH
jgi:hypothetical protein